MRVVCNNPSPFTFRGTGTFIVKDGAGKREAVVVALARLLEIEMTPSAEVMNATGLQAITDRILVAIRDKAANQPATWASGVRHR